MSLTEQIRDLICALISVLLLHKIHAISMCLFTVSCTELIRFHKSFKMAQIWWFDLFDGLFNLILVFNAVTKCITGPSGLSATRNRSKMALKYWTCLQFWPLGLVLICFLNTCCIALLSTFCCIIFKTLRVFSVLHLQSCFQSHF